MTGPYNYGPAPDYDAEFAAAHNPALPQDQLLRLWHTRPDLREALAQLPACPPNLAAQVKFSDPWRDPNARSHRGIIMAFAMLAGLLVVVGLGYVGYMAVHGDGSTQQQTHGMLPPNDPKTTSSAAAATTTAPPPVPSSPIKPVDLSTNCVQAEDGTDSNGVKYIYDPAKAFDNDPLTAWRCQWKEQDGQSITAKFDHPTLVTSVGLVPGYAKTDIDGSDRFAQNRKITRVRWEFSDGSSVKQQVPVSRALASVKVNVVTDSVTMVIEATEPGVSIVNKNGQRQDAFNGLVSVSEIEIMGTQPPSAEGPAPAPAPAPLTPPRGAAPAPGASTPHAAPAQP